MKEFSKYITFSSSFLGSSLLSVKTTRLKIYIVSMSAGLNECNNSAEAVSVGACVVGSSVDSPSAALGRTIIH